MQVLEQERQCLANLIFQNVCRLVKITISSITKNCPVIHDSLKLNIVFTYVVIMVFLLLQPKGNCL